MSLYILSYYICSNEIQGEELKEDIGMTSGAGNSFDEDIKEVPVEDYCLCPSHCSFWFNDHTRAASHSDVPTSMTRWVRQHRPNHQVHSHSKIDTTLTQTTISSLFNEVSYYASHVNLDFKEAREVAIQFMWRLKKRRAMTKEDNPNSVQRNRKTKLFGIGDPNIVKTKGNPGGNSSIGKPKRPRKCGRCRVPGHTKRTCPKFPSANRGAGSNLLDKNDYQPSATHCPSEDGYPTPPPSPFTQTGCKRKSTGLVMTHRVKRQLYTNHERTDLTNGAIQSRHDINRATASHDAQVCQNGSFSISEASKVSRCCKRKAYNEFGFEQMNGLLVPCSVDAFPEVVSAVEFSHGRFDFGKFVEEFI
ncbi:hypothetical protein RHMOL_Rhmol06G0073700 [Rhododendron molle]|uniref:Uncharacterized protein n=1 Tax=Rhododendron molle TaxID=49168 RepID=A0ACC0NB78_RHOML|nr:hypothetical protein RHMOL_Rhmol06G0073700 [Rhododendron molle]